MSGSDKTTKADPAEKRDKLSMPELLAIWTASELLYFPYSPRVLEGAEADELLEASISEKFQIAADSGLSKVDLAKEARNLGVRMMLTSKLGSDPSEKDIAAEIKRVDDSNLTVTAVKIARRSHEIMKPLVSLASVRNAAIGAPESRSAFKPGLFIIYGGAESNKSHRLSRLHAHIKETCDCFSHEYLIMGEPDYRSLGSWRELIATLRFGLLDDHGEPYVPDVMLIDSLKDLIYMPGDSGSGSGGLSTSAIMEFSSISAQLMREGRTVVAVINPSQPKYLLDMYETLKSNVTGIFFYNPPRSAPKGGDSEIADHFSVKSSKKLISSLRVWNKDGYYDRLADQEILSLISEDGDILDLPARIKTVVGTVIAAVTPKNVSTSSIKERLLKFTPRNEG